MVISSDYYDCVSLPHNRGALIKNRFIKREFEDDEIVLLYLLDDAFKKVHSDRLLVVASEDAFAEALDHARLADGPVADDDHLEKVEEELVKPYRLRHDHIWFL